jgi:hypothetical protein
MTRTEEDDDYKSIGFYDARGHGFALRAAGDWLIQQQEVYVDAIGLGLDKDTDEPCVSLHYRKEDE